MNTLLEAINNIKNGYMAKKEFILLPLSNFVLDFLQCLKKNNYISNYEEDKHKKYKIKVQLKYIDDQRNLGRKLSAVKKIRRVSTKNHPLYLNVNDLNLFFKKQCFNGFGNAFLSTVHGVLSVIDAKKRNVGGTMLCVIL